MGQWRHLLEDDPDTTHFGQWIGFYKDKEVPTFVLQLLTGFTPPCMRLHHLLMPLQVQCFMVGTHFQCLSEWEIPTKDMVGFFHEVIIIHTTRGQKKMKKSTSFMANRPLLARTRIIGVGYRVIVFLIIPRNLEETLSSTGTWGPQIQWTNGKAIYWGTTSSSGPMCGIRFGLGTKLLSCGPFGIKLWQLTNGGLASHWLPFISSASQTRVNQSNIKFGIAFKRGKPGGGPCSSCMNYVGFEPATMIVFIGNKLCLGKGFLRNSSKRSNFGTFFVVLHFGLFGLSAMTKCSTMNNATSLRSNTLSGMNSSSSPRQHGNGWLSKLRLATSRLKLCSKASTKLGVLRMSFVEGTIWISLGIENNNIVKQHNS